MANSSFYSGTGTNPTDVDSITSSKTAAETAATNAATSEANAATSATNAAASATDASNSASSISGSVAAAASSATDSANSATSSSTSATQAATSASNAAASATSASTSAASATSSASSSADSALDASGSATAAASSATSASTSASNAATSEANAATSASQAATSASTAQAAAANTDVATVSSNVSYVQTVADNISDVETVSNNVLKINTVADNVSGILAANSSSTQAVSSAADAASSATQAASSATSAATSASTATAAKDAALEALDNFDDRYLGQKASDPTVDNDGDALVAGALYFDTTTDTMKVYEGSIWVAAYASLSGALIAANNLSDVTNVTTARTNLGLGTAATTASTDYATAAQGTLADTSVQPNDSPTFGSITVTGTVDGRDVAADGTKLDAIEASADVTDTANVTAAGALMDSELTSEASVKALDQGVATTDSPTFAGLTTTADVSFGDNDKAIFGASSDLQVFHNGTDSFIREVGTGGLKIDTNGPDISLRVNATENAIIANSNGSVDLYYDNAAKLATTSTGVDITGTLGVTTVDFGDWTITESGGSLYFATGGTNKMKLDASGNLQVVGSVDANATIS